MQLIGKRYWLRVVQRIAGRGKLCNAFMNFNLNEIDTRDCIMKRNINLDRAGTSNLDNACLLLKIIRGSKLSINFNHEEIN